MGESHDSSLASNSNSTEIPTFDISLHDPLNEYFSENPSRFMISSFEDADQLYKQIHDKLIK